MSRIDDIILRTRDVLADLDQQRWTDAQLLRLVDDGQKDIATHSKILKSSYTFSLADGVHTYTLPDNIWLITRASDQDGCRLALISYDSMDEQVEKLGVTRTHRNQQRFPHTVNFDFFPKYCWETDTGKSPLALVYDNRNLNQIRVYPIPDKVSEIAYSIVTGKRC